MCKYNDYILNINNNDRINRIFQDISCDLFQDKVVPLHPKYIALENKDYAHKQDY